MLQGAQLLIPGVLASAIGIGKALNGDGICGGRIENCPAIRTEENLQKVFMQARLSLEINQPFLSKLLRIYTPQFGIDGKIWIPFRKSSVLWYIIVIYVLWFKMSQKQPYKAWNILVECPKLKM